MTFSNWFISTFHDELSWTLSRVREAEQHLGPEDDWIEDDRRYFFEAANAVMAPLGRPTIQEVPTADHIVTVEASPNEVEEMISPPFQRNLLSTRKYRVLSDANGGRQYAVGSWVLDPQAEPWQQHIYLFPAPGGGTEIYGHLEPSVRDPDAHVNPDTGAHGDPKELLRSEL